MAIVTYPLNGIDFDGENAETYLCTRTSGVYSADDNFAASVTGDRQVSISKGLAWIRNTDFAGKSVCNTESVAIEIPLADGTRPRIDRIVLRFDKAANASSIVLKQGTPSSAPAAPTVERTELVYELGLCTVLVPAASTIVSAGDVTSTLLDESVCGLMRDGVTGIPTEQLQDQTQALIDELREVIAGVEAGSEVMLKATYGGSADGVVKDSDNLGGKSPQWWMPTGSVVPYAGENAPDGWLLCDGSAVSRTTYAALFAVIGTTYGGGDNSTTFNLPNLNGRVLAGAGTQPVGTTAGADTKQIARANLPNERLQVIDNGAFIVDSVQTGTQSGPMLTLSTRQNSKYINTDPLGSGQAFDVRQATLYINYIIKI